MRFERLEARELLAADAGGPYVAVESSSVTLTASGNGPDGLLFDAAAITSLLQEVANSDAGVHGISALIGYQGQIIYEQYLDGHTAGQVLDLASATKWLSATTILTAWDDGLFDLDAPLSNYVPEFTALPTGDLKREMTMRQLFSHTSGLPTDATRIRQGTLADFAARVAIGTGSDQIDLIGPPGGQYLYGNVSMQTGGGVIEMLTGESWVSWVQQHVFDPLGMTASHYETSFGRNPLVAGGAKAPITDYGKMLEMILSDGHFNGQQVLSPAAIDELFTPNTEGLAYLNNPPRFPGGMYALGCWTDVFDEAGNPIFVDSPGKSGFVPWIDLENRYWAIVMIDEDSRDETQTTVMQIHDIISSAINTPTVYAWDLDNNGTFETTGQSVNFPADDVGQFAVPLRVTGPGGVAFDSATITVIPQGDANADGLVDGGDYTVWADHYLQSTSQGYQDGDFNRDGLVDGGDYTLWADYYSPLLTAVTEELAVPVATRSASRIPDGSASAETRFDSLRSAADTARRDHATMRAAIAWTSAIDQLVAAAELSGKQRRSARTDLLAGLMHT